MHLIADSWTGDVSYLRDKFPQADITVIPSDKKQQAHGHMMAECFLTVYPTASITLCHMLDDHLAIRENLVRCSASWSFGSDLSDMENEGPFVRAIAAEQKRTLEGSHLNRVDGGLIFASAGNSDESKHGRPDINPDLATPQEAWRRMFPNVFLIAACDPENGMPALFSGDSVQEPPDVAYPGENILVWNPVTREPQYIKGTSPAAQFAAAHVLRTLGPTATPLQVRRWWAANGRIAHGWTRGQLHRKNGSSAFLLEDILP